MSPVLLLLLGGCGEPPASTPEEVAEEEAFAPTFGAWSLRLGATWAGDCALEDDNTYLSAEQTVVFDSYRYGFSMRDEQGYWYPCFLDQMDFVCELPVTADDFRTLGYDIQATYTPTLEGAFLDADHLSGVYQIAVVCEGEDCDLLTGYGEDFSTPCTAVTDLEADAEEL